MTGHYDWSYVMIHPMENTITATKAKAEFLGLIDRVASGASGPVTITKHGKAKVMIVPIGESENEPRGYGALRGQAIARLSYDPQASILTDEPSNDLENLVS
jgi:prevent-host-death family protein